MSETWQSPVDSNRIIRPDQLHLFCPGDILAEGSTSRNNHRRVFFREYGYPPAQYCAPGIEDLVVIIFGEGSGLMRRRFDDGWREAHVKPGDISFVGAGRAADWEWPDHIKVSQIYLSNELMADSAASEFEQDYRKLETKEVLKAADHELQALGEMIARELRSPGNGQCLLVDSLAQALSVHLLRRYHRGNKPRTTSRDNLRLTTTQRNRVLDFIDAHISRNFSLSELVGAAEQDEADFLHRFRNTFGEGLHQFVLGQRTRLAVELIRQPNQTLAEITLATGFADQASMTHAVKSATGLSPSALRKP